MPIKQGPHPHMVSLLLLRPRLLPLRRSQLLLLRRLLPLRIKLMPLLRPRGVSLLLLRPRGVICSRPFGFANIAVMLRHHGRCLMGHVDTRTNSRP
jgi:hypothetical protein